MDSFETLLANAIKRCEKLHVEMFEKDFSLLYPFTTENISGYINLFNLDKLLTVGSSGDQVLNAIMGGARTIDVLDVNPYTKYYYYLKVACLLELELSEFLSFFRYFVIKIILKFLKIIVMHLVYPFIIRLRVLYVF